MWANAALGIATMLLRHCTLQLPHDFSLSIRQMPTISPKQGLPMRVQERTSAGRGPTEAMPLAV